MLWAAGLAFRLKVQSIKARELKPVNSVFSLCVLASLREKTVSHRDAESQRREMRFLRRKQEEITALLSKSLSRYPVVSDR